MCTAHKNKPEIYTREYALSHIDTHVCMHAQHKHTDTHTHYTVCIYKHSQSWEPNMGEPNFPIVGLDRLLSKKLSVLFQKALVVWKGLRNVAVLFEHHQSH